MTWKEFAKKRENYWYHYKAHTIAGIFVLIVALITIRECATRINYDAIITLISQNYVSEQVLEKVTETIKPLAQDINDDGEVHVLLSPIFYNPQPQSEQDIMMVQKINLEFAAGESCLYIVQREDVEKFHEMFTPLQELVDVDGIEIDGDKKAVKVADLRGLAQLDLHDDLYLAVTILRDPEKNDKQKVARHEMAKRIVNELQ